MCDYRKQEYPVNGSFLLENFIYIAIVTTGNQIKFYVGSTGLTFNKRYTKHKHSFRHVKHGNSTTLLQHIWKLKNNNVNFKIQ